MNFFTAYKKVDNFIKDAYSSDKGISTYIDELQAKRYNNWYGVNWEDTYQQLKHYRYIRNQIAHEDNTDEKDLCSTDDIVWLERFYGDLMNGRDPLALRALKECQVKELTNSTTEKQNLVANVTPTTTEKENTLESKEKSGDSISKRLSNFFRRLFKG